MNRHLFVLLFGFVAINISCTVLDKKTLSDIETINVDYEQVIEKFDLKNIVDTNSYQTIVLETTDDCMIGEVTKLSFRHDTVFVFDKVSKSVFLFNNTGQYLSKICRIGRGRQEYMDLTDVFISDDHILILDNYQFKVCCYDFKGNFKYGFDSKEGVRLTECDGKIFACTTWGGGSLWKNHKMVEFDSRGRINSFYIKMTNNDKERIEVHDYFIPHKNGFELLVPSKNIVYKYENDYLMPSYRFDFGENEMPEEISRKGLFYIITNKLQEKYSLGVHDIMDNGKYRLFYSDFNDATYSHIYDISGKTLLTTCSNFLIDGMCLGYTIEFDDEQLAYYYNGHLLCEYRKFIWEDGQPKGFADKLYQASKNLTDTDNGVIIRMKLKGYDED